MWELAPIPLHRFESTHTLVPKLEELKSKKSNEKNSKKDEKKAKVAF